jgi:outer membrane protein OmpA-like peptidoglycan-associated protein
MLKKVALTLMVVFAGSVTASAIELPPGAVMKDGSPVFDNLATAYTSNTFNEILGIYGLQLSPEATATIPGPYAKVADGMVMFNNNAMAYTPAQYHAILTAYGLQLSPEEVTAKLGWGNYATVKNGEIVFGQMATLYNQAEWISILSAYSLPTMAAPAPAVAGGPGDSDGDGVTDDKDACPGTPAGVQVDERGCWAMSSEVLFDFDKAVLKNEFKPTLDDTKKVFDAQPELKVQIEGHTDSIGTDAYNQKLSERRANAVKKYLVEQVGISADRLKAVGYGESRPAYSNDTKEGRSKNRRVEFSPMQ